MRNSTGALTPNAKMPPRFPGAAFNVVYATRTLLFVFVRLSFVLLARLAEAKSPSRPAGRQVRSGRDDSCAAAEPRPAFPRLGVERRRRIAADEHRVVGAEDHVEQLAHVVVGRSQVVLDEIAQAMLGKAGLELFDSLGANAFDAQKLIFGVADQVANGLDARFAELVSPTLRNAQVVVDIQTSILIGEVVAR